MLLAVSKPLRWLAGEVKTPPMSVEARREMGFLLRQLQEGENLTFPHCRPMATIGRLLYLLDSEAIVILEIGEKKSRKTSQAMIELCRKRLKSYEQAKKQGS